MIILCFLHTVLGKKTLFYKSD